MAERGMVFSGESVRAILAGRKSVERRPLRLQPLDVLPMNAETRPGEWVALVSREPNRGMIFRCRWGVPGDRLWVRETWTSCCGSLYYRADGEMDQESLVAGYSGKWRSPIYMPRWASRLTLEIVAVRCERLQEISKADAIAEGVYWSEAFPEGYTIGREIRGSGTGFGSAEGCFAALWHSIYARRGLGWTENPWVWRIELRRATDGAAAPNG